MSRDDKLNERLQEIEAQYRELLRAELEELVKGGYSRYLHDMEPKYPVGKSYRRSYRKIEKLEEEIVRLSQKLGVGIEESAVEIAREFARKHKGVSDSGRWREWWKGKSTTVSKELLAKLLVLP